VQEGVITKRVKIFERGTARELLQLKLIGDKNATMSQTFCYDI